MTKKKWALLIAAILLLAGYFKFFYKTYSETAVAKSADLVFAVDVKRVTNTLIWNTITTPSQWRKISFSSSDEISWKDMIKFPDYVFVFHCSGQPYKNWYSVFEIKDNEDFNKGLQSYHFEKDSAGNYFSKELGIVLMRSENKLLIGTASSVNLINQVAEELFIKKNYIVREKLQKSIDAASHFSLFVAKNNFLKEDAVIKANFGKTKILIESSIQLKDEFDLSETDLSYPDSSLLVSGFTQPPTVLYELIPASVKTGISKAVNFNIDSLLLPGNHDYRLDIPAFKPGIDTAISYTYDDNFNPVEKRVVNKVLEPSLQFSIRGKNVSGIYDYWNNNSKLEKTAAGDLFTPLPFVRSYCKKISAKELAVISYNYQPGNSTNTVKCIFFLRIIFSKIPAEISRPLPENIVKTIANLELMKISIQKKQEQVIIEGKLIKKKNDLPVISW